MATSNVDPNLTKKKIRVEFATSDKEKCKTIDNKNINFVKNAIGSQLAPDHLDKCFKAGSQAAAITVAVASLQKKWPWMKVADVEDNNVISFNIEKGKEKAFNDLFEKKRIFQQLSSDFEDISLNLEGILGEDIFKQLGATAMDMMEDLDDFEVAAVDYVEADDKSGDVINKDIKGGSHVTLYQENQWNIASGHGGSGTTANLRVSGNSKATIVQVGGVNIAGNPSAKDMETLSKLRDLKFKRPK